MNNRTTLNLMIKNTSALKFQTGVWLAILAALLAPLCYSLAQSKDAPQRPATALKPVPSSPQSQEVRVNGRVLTEPQMAGIEAIYHVRPKAGSYWYDARSGLYGLTGGPAAGLMLPGHNLGSVAEDASAGKTMVWVNRRRIPFSEWLIWSAVVGAPVQPGRYWLDASGDVGYEGIPVPFLNLHTVAARGGPRGGGNRAHSSVLTSWDRTGVAVLGGAGVLTATGR
jgi:hypothetical protein